MKVRKKILTLRNVEKLYKCKGHLIFFLRTFHAIFALKYMISTPLMIEKPVRSPIVPPIADN